MTKHTPGEWQIQDFSLSWLRIVAEDGVTTICELPFLKEAHFAEVRANARLIKTSPKMMAALKDYVAETDSVGLSLRGVKAKQKALAVIREAEGETDV